MTKENQKKLAHNQLVASFLYGVSNNDPKRTQEVYEFFKTQYVDLSDHEIFEEQSYRVEWQANLGYLQMLSDFFANKTPKEVARAFEHALDLLHKEAATIRRKEANHD
jgi:hypothetical protein